MTKKRKKTQGDDFVERGETVEWKLHDELAQALNSHDFVEVWGGATTPTQVRAQLRITDWDRWLSLTKTIRLLERSHSGNPWNLHICQEFVLRPNTDDLVATWHFTVRAPDNVSAVKQICNRISAMVPRAAKKVSVKNRVIPQGEGVRGPGGVVSYPLAGQPPDRNVPVNGKGAVQTKAGTVK